MRAPAGKTRESPRPPPEDRRDQRRGGRKAEETMVGEPRVAQSVSRTLVWPVVGDLLLTRLALEVGRPTAHLEKSERSDAT